MKFYSRRVTINFVCTGHGRRLNVRLKWEERINREKEGKIKNERETKVRREGRRERERDGERGREGDGKARVWKKGWESKREENCLSCYRRYVSVNMCPASEHTDCIRGYIGSNSSSSASSSSGRDRGSGSGVGVGGDDSDGDGDGDEGG